MSEILFIGPQSSGKSLLLTRLKKLAQDHKITPFDQMSKTAPTKGTENNNFIFRGVNFNFKELGGESIADYAQHAESAKGVVYVFDSADFTTTATNIVYLNDLLTNENLETKPILIVLSKCDIPDRIKFSVIDSILTFDNMKNPDRIEYLETSSVIGIGLNEIFQWVAELNSNMK